MRVERTGFGEVAESVCVVWFCWKDGSRTSRK